MINIISSFNIHILNIDYHNIFLEIVYERLYTDIYTITDIQSKFNVIIAIIYFFY